MVINGLGVVERLLSIRADEVSELNSISKVEAVEIQGSVAQLCSLAYTTAGSIYRRSVFYKHCLHTGSDRVDGILGGGVYTGEITEIQGQSASGKSQFCFSLIAELILKNKARVVFVDSTNSFSSLRLAEICAEKVRSTREGFSEAVVRDALRRVECFKTFSVDKLARILGSVDFCDAQSPVRLVVVDSITSLLSPYMGSTSGNAVAVKIAKQLRFVALQYGVAVVVTNSTVVGQQLEIKAALGLTWASLPSTAVFLSCSGGSHRAKVVKSSKTPCHIPATFIIAAGGIV